MTPEPGTAAPLALTPELREAVRSIAATDQLLVAMDFDGTMAPIVPHADDARPLPRAAAAFAGLAALPRTTTALISGRALASLRSVASPPAESLLIGSHGAEAWLGPGSAGLELDDGQQTLLAEVRDILAGIAQEAPGTMLEDKPAGVVLHTRQAADDVAEDAVAAARSLLEDREGVFLKNGKRVLETSVVHASKGEAVAFLRQAAGATAVLFAGDDTTDEDAFARLMPGDVGVKVGLDFTQAQYRVEAPIHVAELLEALLAARTSAVGEGN
ncbi:HAD-superfamily hydrolase, subfamily IIB [Pseudarthrobacter chlorophenolicus A6]|uniref:Trehalose 6-phosphate phosphatase n=1 Tax=Pseudarthrobacter chlorophenolicus (strain ATCC 700700 / DSM 12829 / CIP 107037 / JCM 12360 / KCTC 9906 / NCIMB 13794 / A6) TaxID=452863 RepID=B8HCT0_PSECP|nr:trehalose-phosphatase [Pseudarthrobacter chlorophenolicus]ACL38863.1 HAD-superfamily hydrolase, subfamily IIB [Pseudarthrobacter chlorophenolicus A6]SDR07725.1 trehalose 6-phosphatase [Pseudarthrobacter chlorophenolicus]